MERNANYALVGAVSLLLFIGAMVFVVWLARTQFANQYSIYDVDFKGPVRGLSSGGDVYFNGIKVGEVTKLSLDRRDPNRVVARVRTSADAPIRVDSTATLEPQGVTGVNYIQIAAGTASKPLLKEVTPRDVIPVIKSKQGAFEGLLEGGGTVLARAVEALDRVNALLSEKNVKEVSGTLEDVHALTTAVKNKRQLLENADKLLINLTATSGKIAKLSDDADTLLTRDGRETLANVKATSESLRTTAEEARRVVASIGEPTKDFATNGLPQVITAIQSLQQATESLNRLVSSVEENPRGLLAKPASRTLEVRP